MGQPTDHWPRRYSLVLAWRPTHQHCRGFPDIGARGYRRPHSNAGKEFKLTVPWDQQATLIDLDGTTPLVATLRECVRHFAVLKASAQSDARILLTQPVARAGRKTRTWVLNPDEIAGLVAHLRTEPQR